MYKPSSFISRSKTPTPSNLLGMFKHEPVYDTTGPLGGEALNQWVLVTGKGFRRILDSEWCSLKGYTPIKNVTHSLEGISRSVSSHIWSWLSYLLYPLLPIKHNKTKKKKQLSKPTFPTSSITPINSEPWTWNPPDLSITSAFFHGNIARLKQALWSFPSSQHQEIFDDGLQLLSYHRQNYSDKKIHWYELYYGISMNFMELPFPEIIPNQRMTKEHTTIGVKFMDSLIKLKVFEKVSSAEVYNNLPLFCVPKPKPEQKGEYRCISNGKSGGQNRHCVPDPVQMTDPCHILPRL